MAAESDAKAQSSETSSLRSRWLDGTNVKSAKELSEAVPVKAKPKVPPEGLLPSDPWEGKQLHPQEDFSPGRASHGGRDPWEKYHSAEPLSTEADIFAPRSRGTANERKDKRDPRDIPVMYGSRKLFPRPRGFGGTDERISHCMGKFLRYRSEELGRDEDGYVELPSLLEEIHDEVPWATTEDLRRVAQTSFSRHGKRFQTRDIQSAESGKVLTLVRATYKHGDEFPRGRRRTMERMSGSGGFSASPTAEEAMRHFEMSPRDREEDSEQRYDIEEQFAALHQDSPPAGASKEVAADVPGSCKAGATASEVSTSTEATTSPQEEVWERFLEPVTLRVWFWNPKTEEVLYPDALEDGWELFHTEEGQRWFWQETTGRYFFEETKDDK